MQETSVQPRDAQAQHGPSNWSHEAGETTYSAKDFLHRRHLPDVGAEDAQIQMSFHPTPLGVSDQLHSQTFS